MSGPTPGPWTVESFRYVNKDGTGPIAEVSNLAEFVVGEQEANALLCAAAPDLLAACEVAVKTIELASGGRCGLIESQALAASHGELCKAIAKAKGTP